MNIKENNTNNKFKYFTLKVIELLLILSKKCNVAMFI